MTEKFDYDKAIAELESIAAKVEDPSVGIGDIDRYISRTNELVGKCREYLRTAREEIDGEDLK